MSQKKTIVLNPLPEQTDDYSRYEETVTRWDRIIAAGVIVVLLISVTVYFLMGEPDYAVDIAAQNNTISADKAALVESEKEEAVVGQLAQPSQPEPASLEANPAEEITAQAVNRLAAQQNQGSQALPADKPLKQATLVSVEQEPETAKLTQTATTETLEAPKSSGVKVFNDGITSAVLTLGIKDGKPGSSIPPQLVMPQEGIMKVILFTEMHGLLGKKLFHDWYRNGVRQARVTIPVNFNEQSSHSSKYINAQMAGDWQVKVVDDQSDAYVLAGFKVVLP